MSRYSLDDNYEQSSIDFSVIASEAKQSSPEETIETHALTVSAALSLAKSKLEAVRVTIIGEISEISDKPGYKAIYFTISDESSALPCLVWRNVFERQGIHQLQRGMLVEINGRFSLYAAKGRMNFEVHSISLAGEGQLRLRVAQLAKKLEAQGLMDPERKLLIPQLPQRIALVTSPRGKAVHDVIRTLRRRFPLATVLLYGVAVEGHTAASELIRAVQAAQESDVDVILLVRGGGSYEDLMPFNDEGLAIQIANSKTPIITGIGHEPDNSIADMVASFRASTPTAAAERAVPDISELQAMLNANQAALSRNLTNQLSTRQVWLSGKQRLPLFTNSQALTATRQQNLEQTGIRLQTAIPNALARTRVTVKNAAGRLPQIGANLLQRHQDVYLNNNQDIQRCGKNMLASYQNQLVNAAGLLESLSPLAILRRGYSATYGADGKIISTISGVKPKDWLNVRVRDGIINCTVQETREEAL